MRFSALILKTPPIAEPFSLELGKAQLKVDDEFSDALIQLKMAAVRDRAQDFLGRAMLTQTWTLYLDEFPDGSGGGRLMDSFAQHNLRAYRKFREIEIPRPPLQAVNSIKYIGRQDALDPTRDSAYDAASRLHTLDPINYRVDTFSEPGRVVPITSEFWPFTDLNLLSPAINSVQIEFVAGYADATTLAAYHPKWIEAMLTMLGSSFENREEVISGLRAAAVVLPNAAEDLLWPDRIVNFF